ncbi:MAG: zf-HC2 domain-containing protein [Candidatus Krumholzibacteria bacterium]|nr:zf-HC2 domain-containing protein [Candidatus Krumholzibacteria bacterium]
MDCRKFRRMVSRQLDGALDGASRADLESHLSSCTGCRRFRDLSLAGLSMHRSVKEADPPRSLFPSILAAVEVGPRWRWNGGWLRAAVPAAAAAAAVLGVWVGGLIHESYAPATAGNQADVLELTYLDEYPPGSMGDILMTSNGGGGDEQR